MNRVSRSSSVMIAAIPVCLVIFGSVLAGSLTPPGPPAPTMKTLDQVEPRIPISFLPFTINQPGSYYLTGNLFGVSGQNGISVYADNVTIDLNGFALIGVGGSFTGIYGEVAPYPNNLRIRNGTIRDWGGVGIGAIHSLNIVFEDLVVSGNGLEGIWTGSGMISHVVARNNVSTGIELDDPTGGTIKDCQAVGNSSDGIDVSYNVLVTNNEVYHNGFAGIGVGQSGNRIEANHVVANSGGGIQVLGTANIIIKNTAISNPSGNYVTAAGNDVGPIGTAAASTSPWANISD